MAGSPDRLTIKPSSAEIGVGIALAEPPDVDLSEIEVDNTVSLYFQEIAREPLLTRQEEIELAKTIEAGWEAEEQLEIAENLSSEESFNLEFQVQVAEAARSRLIRANMRLVASIAKKYQGHGVPFPDLIQEGNLGLMRAVEKFDYRKGNRFSTYATWWIRQKIGQALPSQGRTIRLPIHENKLIRTINNLISERERFSGYRPTPEELAEELEIPVKKINLALRVSQKSVSLAKPVGKEKEGELGDLIANEGESPEEVLIRRTLAEHLEEVLNTLPPEEAEILRLRFGLIDGHEHTLRDVGKKKGVTRERIRQIQQKALRRLRHPRRRRLLKDYWKS